MFVLSPEIGIVSQPSPPRNFAMPAGFTGAIAISTLLLVLVGGALFFFPEVARPRWVWTIAPYNTGFLGAVYLSAVVPLSIVLWVRRWSPVRLILPMLLTFVTQLLVVSFIYSEAFDLQRRATGLWFGLYLADTLVATYYLGRFWARSAPKTGRTFGWSRLLKVQAAIFGFYGVGLLLLPATFGSFWPWTLDAFHGRLYSAIFTSGAVGCGLLARAATRTELRALGSLQVALGSLVVAALLRVDAQVGKVDWSAPGTWIWLALFFGLAALGATTIAIARQSLGSHSGAT